MQPLPTPGPSVTVKHSDEPIIETFTTRCGRYVHIHIGHSLAANTWRVRQQPAKADGDFEPEELASLDSTIPADHPRMAAMRRQAESKSENPGDPDGRTLSETSAATPPAQEVVATIRGLEAKVEELVEGRFIPGQWCCPKCKFSQVNQTIYTGSGNIGVSESDRTHPDLCPNDGTMLERVTWEEEFNAACKSQNQWANIADDLRGKLDKEIARITELETANKELTSQLATLQRVNEINKADAAKAERECGVLKVKSDAYDQKQIELESYAWECGRLNNQIAANTKRQSEVVSSLTSKLANQEEMYKSLTSLASTRDGQIASLREDLKLAQAIADKEMQRGDNLKTELAKEQDEGAIKILSITVERDKLCAELTELKSPKGAGEREEMRKALEERALMAHHLAGSCCASRWDECHNPSCINAQKILSRLASTKRAE